MTASGQTPTANVSRTFTDYIGLGPGSRYYLIGNPFARPLAASGVTTSPGAIQGNVLQIWDPAQGQGGGYILIDRTDANDYLAVWQGAFIEVATAGNQTVTYSYAATSTTATPPFYGRSAPAGALAFRLDGTLASGAVVLDEAARLRFDTEADAGWDALDASKLDPLAATYALVAPVLVRDGAPYRAAISTVPPSAATVPLAFTATEAGTFTLTWSGTLPDGLSGSLRDLATGTVTPLAAGSYAFEAAASPWADRFDVVLGSLVGTEGAPAAERLVVGPIQPNPTAATASLRIEAPAGQAVSVRLYDALGRQVAVAFDGAWAASGQSVVLPTAGLAPGAYVVRIESGADSVTRRLTILR